MRKDLDLKACTLTDISRISSNYKIIIKLRRRYVGELPALSELLRLFIVHRFWPIERMLLFLKNTKFILRTHLGRLWKAL